MKSDPINRLRNAVSDSLLPPPRLKLSEWARAKFVLSTDYSATTGNFEPYPYQVEPLDVLSPSDPSEIMALMCGAQMMKTLLAMVLLGNVIDVDPGPALVVQPNEADAKAFSSERIAPMLRDIPCLRGKVFEAKSRDSSNTILHKRFNGGSVALTGTVSPRGLRRRSVRYLILDEIDGYGITSDGDPIALAAARTSKFWNRKILMCSTPTVEGRSNIAKAYAASDQRLYFVPCPLCGHYQALEWTGVVWGFVDKGADGKPVEGSRYIAPEDAHYCCAGCARLVPHHRKWEMLRAGEWRPTNPNGKYPGFRISRLYSPDWSWGKVVTDPAEGWLATKDNPEAQRVFRNNVLAEVWREPGDAPPDYEVLMGRREEYRLGQVPIGPLFLTAGVDVQKSWLEGYVYGWGRGKQRWVIDHFRIEHPPESVTAWEQLTEQLNQTYRHPNGADMPIQRMAIDTGYQGSNGQPVYAWARQHGTDRVLAVDGRPTGAPVAAPTLVDLTSRGKRIKHGCKLWGLNVSHWKSELYGQLHLPRPESGSPYPPGWVHFPVDLPEKFYLQLTSEEFRLSTRRGGIRAYHWEPIENRRHEALDCANYARAMASVLGIDRRAADEKWWRALEVPLGVMHKEAKVTAQIAVPPPEPVQVASTPAPAPRTTAPPVQRARRRAFAQFNIF